MNDLTVYHMNHNGRRLKIMLADDSFANQKLIAALAAKMDWDITIASNGKEAVQIFECDKFDIVFMDMQMPEMDGLEATRLIRLMEHENNRDKTPVVAMTAFDMQEGRVKCIDAGMDDYISKPINFEVLYKVIDRSISKSTVNERESFEHPPADLSNLYKAFGNDTSFIKELVNILIENYPGELEKLKKAVSDSDCKSLQSAAHAFKGSIGNFGADRAHELLFKLESMGKENRIDEAKDIIHELEKELDRVVQFLEKVL